MAVYVTGDTHADQVLMDAYLLPLLKQNDILIILGDFGVGFWSGRYWSEEMFYDYLAEQPYTICFVDGNHENFNKLNAYPVSEWHGGRVHKLRHNVIHLMRGEFFVIESKTYFTFGGGYSFDKDNRTDGFDWWKEEMPCQQEYDHAREMLQKDKWKADYILTHTAPMQSIEYMRTMRLGIKREVPEEWELNLFLDTIQETVSYDKWYFGHFHADRELWRGQYAVLHAVREIQTGKIIRYRI